MATLTAVVQNPPLKAFYERLRTAGKLPKVASRIDELLPHRWRPS
jgi:hypothetical protein